MGVVGVDTGGTFTDFVCGETVFKVPSTPDDPARAVLAGLERLARAGAARIVHGTTVGTNALLTRTAARTAFVTTRGLEDLLEIGRQDRRGLYDLLPRKHDPLVARGDRFGVGGRLAADGVELEPLDAGDLAERLRTSGVGAVAVCLLHAYRNPDHERRVAKSLAVLDLPVSVSHEVANEFREFERAATTVANASLVPVLAPYVGRLAEALGGAGAAFEILQSNGGTATPDEVAAFPVRTVLSGPAGGVVAAAAWARRHRRDEVVSFDMGGTSTDVAYLAGARTPVVPEFRLDGLPLRVPVADVQTVGAGGGSIAWTDALGALRVGPASAGADPGPACYGRGEQPTVTDAHAVLGQLSGDAPLAGSLQLDVARARAAVGDEARARDILRVADATMERAIRGVTVRRGIDPRGATLLAFGGAGPLHACALADLLSMRDVLVPPAPGTFSARGMVLAERRRDFVRTVLLPADEVAARLEELLAPLRTPGAAREIATADVRYRGQSHELSVPAAPDLAARFHAAHEEAYGYADPGRAVEVVNLRVAAVEPRAPEEPGPPARPVAPVDPGGAAAIDRAALPEAVRGPLVVREETATTFLPEGWVAQVLHDGTLWLRRDA